MLKKTLIIAGILVFATSAASFADTNVKADQKTIPTIQSDKPYCKMHQPPKGPDFQKRKAEFEKRLNLTEKQKQQVEELHKKGFEQIKPLMENLKAKQKEAYTLKDASDEQSVQKREQLKKEIGALKQQAQELRKQNMKDFENILTKKQQKELSKIKEEGRKKFEQEHKRRPHTDFNGKRGSRPDRPMPQPIEKDVK